MTTGTTKTDATTDRVITVSNRLHSRMLDLIKRAGADGIGLDARRTLIGRAAACELRRIKIRDMAGRGFGF